VRDAAGILFDLDGVLVDSYEVWFHLLDALARELGYPPVSREAFARGLGQGIQADVERFFPRHTVPALERLYAERFESHLGHLRVMDGVARVFDVLRRRGLPSAVITNTPAEIARGLVERAGATPDVLVGGTDVPRAKPAPDMVLLACDRLGIPPAASWVVGDTPFDRDAARAAGARFAGLGLEGDVTLGRLTDLVAHLGDR
jgi:phosphoglycolate phosphatase/AHBA synthesis associated protein